jgi:inosine-uridine nucleoside N-ribohydrolase
MRNDNSIVAIAMTVAVLLTFPSSTLAQQKVFIDADVGGVVGTDIQSMLMLLQSPAIEVVGVSIVSGDGWLKASTQRALRMLELTGHGDVPVAAGTLYPLINSREETELWEEMYGEFAYKGIWNEPQPNGWGYHPPDQVPPLKAGNPTIKAIDQHGVNFLIDTLRKYPGEVIVWCGGPLTNVALALRMEPELPQLAKQLVMMGAGFNVDKGGNHRINGRREFNWWWDPEAVRIVMSADWKKITITPVDISVKTTLSEKMKAEIAKSDSPTARYLTKHSGPGPGYYMWDEISAAALIDPSIITRQQEVHVNVDIGHGPGYGETIFVEKEVKVAPWFYKLATVQWDLDLDRFYKLYVDLMKR